MQEFSLTPGVLRMTGSTAALVSFQESRGLLQELAGIEVSTKQVERAAEALGAEIAVDERQQVERMGEVAPPCTWAWMARACPCGPQKFEIARASKRTARPRLGKPSRSRCGRRRAGCGRQAGARSGIDHLFGGD